MLEVGFIGRACFLVFVLLQEFVARGKFLGTLIIGRRGIAEYASNPSNATSVRIVLITHLLGRKANGIMFSYS